MLKDMLSLNRNKEIKIDTTIPELSLMIGGTALAVSITRFPISFISSNLIIATITTTSIASYYIYKEWKENKDKKQLKNLIKNNLKLVTLGIVGVVIGGVVTWVIV